jgi:hypothetical protein
MSDAVAAGCWSASLPGAPPATMPTARQRIREITARSQLRVPVEIIVRHLNR